MIIIDLVVLPDQLCLGPTEVGVFKIMSRKADILISHCILAVKR